MPKEAIKQGVSGYLLKPIDCEELIQQIQSVKAELDKELGMHIISRENMRIAKEKIIYNLVTGCLINEAFLEKMNTYGICFDKELFNISILEIDNFYSLVESNIDETNLIIFSLKNIIEEIVDEEHLGYVYEDKNGMVGIIFNGNAISLNYEYLTKFLQRIRSCVLNYLKINLTIGLGDSVTELAQIKIAHKQALQALERRIAADSSGIIQYKSVSFEESSSIGENGISNIEWDSRKLLSAIHELDEETIINEILLLEEEITKKLFTIDMVKALYNNIIFEIGTLLKEYGYSNSTTFTSQEIFEVKNNCSSIESFHKLLVSTCKKTLELTLALQKGKRQNVIDQILKYIEQHYTEDLSLKTISRLFYINPVYLGRIFKISTGISFNDYINKIRIKEAKKMLRVDDYKISDIIKKLGYQNQEYFYRVFRKYEGISFADYNQNFKNKMKQSN